MAINIQKYISKKDYVTLSIVLFVSINFGLGLGYYINLNNLANKSTPKKAIASQVETTQKITDALDVELSITIEEQDILNDIQKQNETTASTPTKPQSDNEKFKIIDPPKLSKVPEQANSSLPIIPTIAAIKPQTLFKTSSQEIIDNNGRKITHNLNQFGLNAGYIWDTDIAELGQDHPFNFGITEDQMSYFPKQPQHIEQIIPAQDNCPTYPNTIQGQKNWLSFGKYAVESPIQNGSFGDFYNFGSDGQINLGSEIQEDKNAILRGNYESVPAQKLLKYGVVHLPITPAPGQVGNSYIIGHTSNFPQVQSAYNKIFKPFESKSQVGDEFTIWDHKCRQMTFRVFEAFAIGENDTATAYQNMGNKRVVTLQGSILDSNWQPTKRWLTRGELAE